MRFLTNWTLNYDKLPKYTAFKGNFEVDVPKKLLLSIYDSEKEYLTKERKDLLKNVIDSMDGDILKVKHHQRCGDIGRFYADKSISLITLSRHIKHTIFDYLGWIDIDMVKGHPTIVYEIAKQNGFENSIPKFGEYVRDPQKIFDMLIEYYEPKKENKEITRDEQCDLIKSIFNIGIYGGGYSTWLKREVDKLKDEKKVTKNTFNHNTDAEKYILKTRVKHSFVKAYLDECKLIKDTVYNANPDLTNRVKGDLIDEDEIKRRVMSYWCGAIENDIVYNARRFLESKEALTKRKNELPEYDGICFKPQKTIDEIKCMVVQLNEKIKKDTKLNVTFTVKGYKPDKVHHELIEEFETAMETTDERELGVTDDDNDNDGVRFASDDNQASDILFQEVKDKLISFEKRLFLQHNNIWIYDKEMIDNIMLHYILGSKIYSSKVKDKLVPYCQNITPARRVLDALYIKIRNLNNDAELYKKFHTTMKQKLCFLDGVLDFKEKTFTLWKDVKPKTIYSTVQIKRDYGEYFNNPDRETIDKVKKAVFETQYGDKTAKALQFLSRAIAGHHEDKRWATYLGNRNSGKGVEYDLCKNAFGDYVSSFELGNILYNRKTAGVENVDCAKKLYWLIDLEFVRLAVSQEVPDCNSGLKANSKMVKKMAGGGDEIIARRNFDRCDTHFNLDTTFYIKGNNYLECDNNDCDEERLEFNSVIQFKTKEEIDYMRNVEKRDETEMKRYYLADPTIKDKCATKEWVNAFVYLLMENYVLEKVPIEKSLDVEDNSLLGELKKKFDFTLAYGVDVMLCSDVYSRLPMFDKKKVDNELNAMNIHKKRATNGSYKGKNCFYGLKEIPDPVEKKVDTTTKP